MGDLLLRILEEDQGRFVSGEEIGRRTGPVRPPLGIAPRGKPPPVASPSPPGRSPTGAAAYSRNRGGTGEGGRDGGEGAGLAQVAQRSLPRREEGRGHPRGDVERPGPPASRGDRRGAERECGRVPLPEGPAAQRHVASARHGKDIPAR